MKCVDARQFILMADVADLASPGAELQAHLAGCADCATAASRVVSSTSLLREALAARRQASPVAKARRSRSRRVLYTQIPLVLAAGIALVAFFNQRDTAVIPAVATRIGDDTTVVPSIADLTPFPAHAAPVRHTPEKIRPATHAAPAHKDSSTADADSAKAKEDSAWYSPITAALQVTPVSRHQHIAVIGTSNPKVTVVWLTKGDSL